MTELDIEFVRSQFPAFQEPSLRGQAFFENAGGSYACQQVIHRLTRFYHQRKVQPYGPYEASRLGGAEMDEARSGLSAMMGVDADELSFGPSTTQNTYVLSQAFRQMLSPGDAIIVTNQDHEANSGPWRRLADNGIEIREWAINPETGSLEIASLKELIDEKVKLLVFPHCSNAIAEINDVASICSLARDAGIYTCVDGVSYAPHGIPDVAALGADIYLFSAYKTYGPHQGIIVVRRALAEVLPNQGHYFNAGNLFQKFTPAGPDHAQVAACAGMVDYARALYSHHFGVNDASLREIGTAVHDLMRNHEIKLTQPLLDYIGQKNSLRLLGPAEAAKRAPTIALSLAAKPREMAEQLSKHGVMAGGGSFYAQRPIAGVGLDPDHGILRLSFVHYTNQSEIEQLINALDQVL